MPVKQGQNFTFDFIHRIKDISADEWNGIIGVHNFFLSIPYLSALEASNRPDIEYRYIIIRQEGEAVACYYFQVVDLVYKGKPSLFAEGKYTKLLGQLRSKFKSFLNGNDTRISSLVIGGNVYLSGEHAYAFTNKITREELFKLLPDIVKKLSDNLADKYKIEGFLIKDFYEESDNDVKQIKKKSFHRLVVDPNMIMSLSKDWNTFDDYLNAFSSKYRVRAKKALENGANLTYKELSADEIESISDEINHLFLNVIERAPVRVTSCDAEYFVAMKKVLGDEFKFIVVSLNGKAIAFLSAYKFRENLEAHLVGLDYELLRTHSLYQNILYYFVRLAIENKCTKLFFGRTATEIKSTVGAVPVKLNCYLKLNNGLANLMIKPFMPTSEKIDYIARSPFKQV